ncbi:hypothetical protein BP5796_12765 [Coleophoma crateriformis]|uniref:Uncharacterized protein n=1 Tax=Coleophoma crateriformis TaxID=565419 RepID=A0A3D8Q632_9HELO|nr:hypothetical protein BP5796_12765 [Coleophoma crateriformis]
MEGSNTQISSYRNGFYSARHFSASKRPQSLSHSLDLGPESPCLAASIHTFIENCPSLDDYSCFPAPQIFPDAEQQNFTAQVVILSELLDPPQTPDTLSSLFNMNNINEEHEGPAQPTEPILPDGTVSLTCTFPECPEQQPFPPKSALRDTKTSTFALISVLTHHATAKTSGTKAASIATPAKSTALNPTPVQYCPRRAHGIRSPTLPQAPSENSEESSESEESAPRPRYENNGESADGGDDVAIVEMPVDGTLSSEDIRMKLRDLRNSRAKLDKAIRTMERALRIMDGASL